MNYNSSNGTRTGNENGKAFKKIIAMILITLTITILFIIGNSLQTFFIAQKTSEELAITKTSVEIALSNNIGINQTNQLLTGFNATVSYNNDLHEDILNEMRELSNNTKPLLELEN
jgi:hypothetical protein